MSQNAQPDILASILARTAETVAHAKAATPLAELERRAADTPTPRGFARALAAAPGTALIAEHKRASPSAGVIRPDLAPEDVARAYQQGGAACMSVLTDEPFFQGSMDHLRAIRAAVSLPLLRKDFFIDPYQVAEARAAGADAILVIMAARTDEQARELLQAADHWGLDALVETHDEEEMARAASLGARLIGVNNRNLSTFVTDLGVFEQLAPLAPAGALLVAESGIGSRADAERVARAGAKAVLVGESLMRQRDIAAASAALIA